MLSLALKINSATNSIFHKLLQSPSLITTITTKKTGKILTMTNNMKTTQGPSGQLLTTTKVAGNGGNDGKNLLEKERNGGKSDFLRNEDGNIQVETGRGGVTTTVVMEDGNDNVKITGLETPPKVTQKPHGDGFIPVVNKKNLLRKKSPGTASPTKGTGTGTGTGRNGNAVESPLKNQYDTLDF